MGHRKDRVDGKEHGHGNGRIIEGNLGKRRECEG